MRTSTSACRNRHGVVSPAAAAPDAARKARASRFRETSVALSSRRVASSSSRRSTPIVASSEPSSPATTTSSTPVRVVEIGSTSVLGTSRKQNEDRLKISTTTPPFALYAGVFDGHGGSAVSEWLTQNFESFLLRRWPTSKGGKGSQPSPNVEAALTDAFLAADRKLLAPKAGFFGVGERGVGGSKCGSTAALAVLYSDGGSTSLAAANVGDARALLRRNGKAVQLTVDHVPDSEDERVRIERMNPNPKLPLVRYVAGTWRVGGLLALSRAFGDSFMKNSLQFEGVPTAKGTGYSSGFGVVAEPDVTVTELSAGDDLLVLSSDGLFSNEERGGGGGLTNEQALSIAAAAVESGGSCDEAARALAAAAREAGTTDDVTVIVARLGA